MIKKIFSVIHKNDKNFFLILLFLILINAVFETIGIAAIIPLINLLIEDEFLKNFPQIKDFLLSISNLVLPVNFYNTNNEQTNLIFGGAISFLLIFFLKTIFYIFLNYVQNTFSKNINYNLSTRLFKGYLNLDYSFHISRNSSNLMQTIIQETGGFTKLFNNIIIVITEGIIIFFVTIFLLTYSFSASISIFIFLSIISFIIFKITRSKISSWGSERLKFMEKRFQHLQESLDGIKEIYIFQKSLFFLNSFELFSRKFLTAQRNAVFTQNLTKPIFEFVGVLGLLTLLTILMFEKNSLGTIISTIGLFLAASIRLLPSVNKIVSSMQGIKYFKVSLNRIIDEFKTINQSLKLSNNTKKLEFNNEMIFKNVSFSYKEKDKEVLKNLNFKIEKNKIFGIRGASGSGKTTLINLILTLSSPTHGEIKLDDKSLEKNNVGWLKNIGYVSQNTHLIDTTIEKNIAFGLVDEEIDQKKLINAIHLSQLSDFVNNLKEGIKTRVGERGQMVSGGQVQRIGIARALYNNPSILILDEPTSALDIDTENIFMNTIYKLKNKTIIIVSHRESVLNKCDKVLNLNDGKISEN